MTNLFDPAAIAAETAWLIAHPHFDQKPASIREFLGEGYLDIASKVRPGIRQALEDIFGETVNGTRIANYEEAMVTGGVGIGKTTFASICLPYMAHWILCLRDPQDFFDLLPGSRIALMQMSTSETQALQVIYGDIKARIEHSEWFLNNAPHDQKFTKQIRFPKDVWILPGDSAETTFEGYNVLCGILDEMDSHTVTKDKDYAEQGFDTINSRIASRFIDEAAEGHKGLLICIGQMKKGNGFASRKYDEMMANPKAHVTRMSIWESLGWQRFCNEDGSRNSFWYDVKRKSIVPSGIVEFVNNPDLMEIPTAYRAQFTNNPEKALRDLAGIPPHTSDPFISLTHKIDLCVEKWVERHGEDSPVGTNPTRPEFAPWFRSQNHDPRRRHVHIDLATSAEGDAAGLAMGHVEEIIEVDGEKKPYIVIDCMVRIKAAPGTEIMLSDIRRIIYDLKEEYGFRIVSVSMDGFQSTDTMQQLRKKRYKVDYLSVDRSTMAYEDLREAIYEERLEFPPYKTYLRKGDTKLVEIAVSELQQLHDTGKKIDHPAGGSKDVTDAMAGVVNTLMGDRTYRKGLHLMSLATDEEDQSQVTQATGTTGVMGSVLSFPGQGEGIRAPFPNASSGGIGISIPMRLQPRRER